MANEIYDSTWWGNTIDTASSIGTSTEMIQGQFNLTKIGDELVTNGDFATDLSGWFVTDSAIGIDITWTANGVSFITDGAGGGIQQSVITIGKSYLIEFDYTSVSGAIKMLPYFDDISETKRYSKNVVATTTNISFYRKIGGTEGVIDNVSVKEVRATTVEASKCLADTIHRIGLQDIQN